MLDDYGANERRSRLPVNLSQEDLAAFMDDLRRRAKELLLDGAGGWLLANQDDMDRAYSPMTAEEARVFIDGALTPTKGD